MKMPRAAIISLAALAVAAGLAGYAAGRLQGRGESSPAAARENAGASSGGPAIPAQSGGVPSPAQPARPPFALPEAGFSDRAGLDAFVAGLRKSGLSESLAKWLAISMKVRTDLAGSFELAKEADLEREWAVAVAVSDPAGGFELVRTLRGGLLYGPFGGGGAQQSFYGTLGRTNPALGMELLGRLSPYEALSLAPALFASWAEVSHDAALSAASHIEPGNVRESALLGLFREWGERDRRGMLAWAAAQNPQMGKIAFRSQLELSGTRNPQEILELAREFPDAVDPQTVANIAGYLVGQGAEGWKSIGDFPEGPLRDGMVSSFANRMSEANPQGAWALAQSLPPQDRAKFLDLFAIRELAKVAPAEIAEAVRDGDYPEFSSSDVISEWANTDPRAAFAWSVHNLSGQRMASSMAAALSGWAKSDPSAAVAAIDGLAPGMRAKLLPEMLSAWGGSDPKAALAFTNDLPEIDRRRGAAGVINGWAFTDPLAAAQALGTVPPEGMESAYDTVSWRLADKDPGGAAQWALSIQNAGMRNRAASRVTQSWGEKDAAGASEFLTTLEPGDLRDHAAAGFIKSIRDLDPATAAAWASAIGQPEMRTNNLRGALQAWKEKDPAAARRFAAAIESEPLRIEMLRVLE